MERYHDCPQILREFLSYHETIKGQSKRTISEYYLDLRMFFRFVKLMRCEMPYNTPLQDIPICDIDLNFVRSITSSEVFDFLSYLANDRAQDKSPSTPGIGAAARARKLSAIKSLYNYLNVRTKQITENPVKDIEFPKVRRALPKYLTLEESSRLLRATKGPNQTRDFAILMLFLNCGIRRSELVGLNISDVYDDRIRVVGKGNNRISASAVHRLVKKHMLEAGLDASQLSAHKLRHTAATLMLSNGVDLKTLQEVLGHEHLNTTEIYTHIENTELKVAAEANPISHLTIDKQ